jgi:predicted heme/steroid binding protein/uncharacterized membrane protein
MSGGDQKSFTISELKEFDGMEGRPAYLAIEGKVYDVSTSRLWKEGKHVRRHFAGIDLTESLINAPHDEEKLTKFPIVGELVFDESIKQKLMQQYARHIHPILVHFAIAYPLLVPLLSILHVFTGEVSFELASYYLLVLGFVAAPFAGLAGLYSWNSVYEMSMTKTFSQKIMFTILFITVITICSVWRTMDPNILITKTNLSYIYLGLEMSLLPISSILGYYGGKLVYP